MVKVPVILTNQVEERSGENERGPWSFRSQIGQLIADENTPGYIFQRRLNDGEEPLKAGRYIATLEPRAGRFRNTIEWEFVRFEEIK